MTLRFFQFASPIPISAYGVESITTADGYGKMEIDNRSIRKAVETDVEAIRRIYNANMVDEETFLSAIQKGEIYLALSEDDLTTILGFGQWQCNVINGNRFFDLEKMCGSKISTPRSQSTFGRGIAAHGDKTRSFRVGGRLLCKRCRFF